MNLLSLYSFFDELEKESSAVAHGVELAGLGVLAKPSIDRMRGKEVDERKAAKHEVAGLGILAAPSALHLAHSAYKKMRGIPKVASIPNPAALRGRAGVLTNNITKSVASTPAKPKFDLAALKAAYDKQGLRPGLGSVARPSLQLKKTSTIITPYRPAVGSLKATALDAARKAAWPTPPAAAGRVKLVNATPERRDLLAHFTAMAGGGKARVPRGKPAIELPPEPSGPMIITR